MMQRTKTVVPAVMAIVASLAALTTSQERRASAYCAVMRPEESVKDFFRELRVLRREVTPKDKNRERMIRRVRAKVKQDEKLQGGYYRFQANKRLLTEKDLERGKNELRRMLRDRPEMARGLNEDDELFQWAARKFAGEDVLTWIEWSPRDHSDLADGWSRGGTLGRPAQVFVRECHGQFSHMPPGTPRSFDELWSVLSFEMHNVQGHETSASLVIHAIVGEISRHEYILGKARKEYQALLRSRVFYLEVYEPWARSQNIATDPRNWRLNVPDTFDKWIASYPPDSDYPWKFYGQQYDQLAPGQRVRADSNNVKGPSSIDALEHERLKLLRNKLAVDGIGPIDPPLSVEEAQLLAGHT